LNYFSTLPKRGHGNSLVCIDASKLKPCLQCGKCCVTHPCALSPEDVSRIADHFGLSKEELFARFLVLDWVEVSGRRQYYVCPARKGDEGGTIVRSDWAFSDSPCIFLDSNECSIEDVKPKGGRAFYCSQMTSSSSNFIGYDKKKSAIDWSKSHLLRELFILSIARRSRIVVFDAC
jgi:Fe-S-cluster containining protein